MDLYALVNILTWLSPVTLVSGTITGLLYFKRIGLSHKILLFYLVSMVCIDTMSRFFGYFFENNLVFIPIMGFSEIFIFSLLYYFIGFRHVTGLKVFLYIVNIMALLFSLVEMFKISTENVQHFQLCSKAMSSFFIALYAAIFFFVMIRKSVNINRQLFLLNSGVLAFFSLSAVIFLPLDFLINEESQVTFYIWFANLAFVLLFYIFLIYRIWENGKARGL